MPPKINILHVDDSRAIILYIKAMLMEVPAIKMIESAGTVAEAKEVLNTRAIDVAILDINLPDGSGLMLLDWIKIHHPSMKVIMFTNNSDSFFKEAAARSGADHFLDKSMEFEDLIKILKNIQIK
jgi:DNA-binding NarL/FixJ family response regulator